MNIAEISVIHQKGQYETLFDLIMKSKNPCHACFFSMCEDDVITVLKYPSTMICTDSSVACGATVYHPRLRGSFPRTLGKYVREEKVTSLTEMIRKMTSLPASVYGFTNKGYILEGYDADICIFNPDTIIDNADYLSCTKGCDGLNYFIVGGKIAAKDGVYTGEKNGKLVLKDVNS